MVGELDGDQCLRARAKARANEVFNEPTRGKKELAHLNQIKVYRVFSAKPRVASDLLRGLPGWSTLIRGANSKG